MSSQKRTTRKKSSGKESNVRETNESNALRTRKQSDFVRKKQDVIADNATRNAAKTLGTIARGTVDSSDDDYEDKRDKTKRRRNKDCSKHREEVDYEVDNEDDDDDNGKECHYANNNDISKSGFSDESDGEEQSVTNNDDVNNKEHSRRQTNDSRPEYEDELERHGRSDTVAMDVQLIKGVLPELFAVLKFLESDDDLVFDGIICRYFLKKLQVAESKKLEWWKRNSNAVRKSIDGRRASVSNLIKKTLMGMYTTAFQQTTLTFLLTIYSYSVLRFVSCWRFT